MFRIGDDGSRRFHSALLGTAAAVRFINRAAMEDLAYKYVYGFFVDPRARRALWYLAGVEARYRKHPGAEKLNELVRDANECSKPVARNAIKRAVSPFGLISQEKDGVNTIYFASPEQYAKVERLMEILDAISEVIKVQLKNPRDLQAGSTLVPPEVYYNVLAEWTKKEDGNDA
jgi:hypothetical protein